MRSLVRSQYRPRLRINRGLPYPISFCYSRGMTIRPAYLLECGHEWNADLTKPNENWIGKSALCPVCKEDSPVKAKVAH